MECLTRIERQLSKRLQGIVCRFPWFRPLLQIAAVLGSSGLFGISNLSSLAEMLNRYLCCSVLRTRSIKHSRDWLITDVEFQGMK